MIAPIIAAIIILATIVYILFTHEKSALHISVVIVLFVRLAYIVTYNIYAHYIMPIDVNHFHTLADIHDWTFGSLYVAIIAISIVYFINVKKVAGINND